MTGMQIGALILMVAMLIMMVPKLKGTLANTPKAQSGDWLNVVLILAGVGLFVFVLIQLV